MDSAVLILVALGAAMIAVLVLMAIGYSELRMEDDSDDRYVVEAKRMLDEKLKNDRAEPEEDTYVSFEELLEKPKRKNDEKEKWDSLPHYVLAQDTASFGPVETISVDEWDAYYHYLETGVLRFTLRGRLVEVSSLLDEKELREVGIDLVDLPAWYRLRVRGR